MKAWKTMIMTGAVLCACFSCSQNPLEPLKDPAVYTGTWGSLWVIYDDTLNTLGGDVMYYPLDPGPAVFSLSNIRDGTSYSGQKYFRCRWSGQTIYSPELGTNEWSFAGFSLITTSNPAYYEMVPPLDLSRSSYHRITFYARGGMSAGNVVKFEGPGGAILDSITPSGTWTKYSMDLKDLNYVKDFFKVTFVYANGGYPTYAPPGQGGWVDIDYICYEE